MPIKDKSRINRNKELVIITSKGFSSFNSGVKPSTNRKPNKFDSTLMKPLIVASPT